MRKAMVNVEVVSEGVGDKATKVLKVFRERKYASVGEDNRLRRCQFVILCILTVAFCYVVFLSGFGDEWM